MKVLFLVNPNAGGKANAVAVETSCAVFDSAGWDVDTVRTESPEHAEDQLKAAPGNGYELIVVAGGDGTLFHLVQHIPIGKLDDVPFGLIPLGSGNDFYRGLGAQRDFKSAAESIVNGKIVDVDIGLVEHIDKDGNLTGGDTVRFINTAGIGMDSQTLVTRKNAPDWLSARYELCFLMTLPKLYPLKVKIDAGDWELDTDAFWILCCNNSHIGSGMQVAPDAKTNDGLIDILIIPKMSKFSFVMNMMKVFKGTHLSIKGIEIRRAKSINLFCEPNQVVACDGDRTFEGPVRVSILKGAVRMKTSWQNGKKLV